MQPIPSITLTDDQQAALNAFTQFLLDPDEPVFVLQGYSGTGKSTLVSIILERMDSIMKTVRLVNPQCPNYDVKLTATTNKAAEALQEATRRETLTIHSHLGLLVRTDYKTGETFLKPRNAEQKWEELIFIDEASFIDPPLLEMIFRKTRNCKIVLMGDPAQLIQVKAHSAPAFEADFPGAMLSQVVRQAEGNPIIDLSTKFRETVNTGQFFAFKPDGHAVIHLDRDAFNDRIKAEFLRPDWRYSDSKILAWTNKRVIEYNHAIAEMLTGDPKFKEGDYAICNSYISLGGKTNIKTDATVRLQKVISREVRYGVEGTLWALYGYGEQVFHPDSLADRKACLREAKTAGEWGVVREIEEAWIDLRAAYACTVNKSQGSTYDRVFIDLDDISRCNNGNTIARMLYVAVSRARLQVFLTGDLV